eukprot:781385-Lingulodinium_polyedra.AAC.1
MRTTRFVLASCELVLLEFPRTSGLQPMAQCSQARDTFPQSSMRPDHVRHRLHGWLAIGH